MHHHLLTHLFTTITICFQRQGNFVQYSRRMHSEVMTQTGRTQWWTQPRGTRTSLPVCACLPSSLPPPAPILSPTLYCPCMPPPPLSPPPLPPPTPYHFSCPVLPKYASLPPSLPPPDPAMSPAQRRQRALCGDMPSVASVPCVDGLLQEDRVVWHDIHVHVQVKFPGQLFEANFREKTFTGILLF